MAEVATIGLDVAKNDFQAHGADAAGAMVFRKKRPRAKLLDFFAALPRSTVALATCSGAHFWARDIARFGHEVRLIAPAYVKPFVKRHKNDIADSEASCEAAQCSTIGPLARSSGGMSAEPTGALSR